MTRRCALYCCSGTETLINYHRRSGSMWLIFVSYILCLNGILYRYIIRVPISCRDFNSNHRPLQQSARILYGIILFTRVLYVVIRLLRACAVILRSKYKHNIYTTPYYSDDAFVYLIIRISRIVLSRSITCCNIIEELTN